MAAKPDILDRPYPAGLARRMREQQAAEARASRVEPKAAKAIPPSLRLAVNGCSDACRSCTRWTRHPDGAGGCPGIRSKAGLTPGCHSSRRDAEELLVPAERLYLPSPHGFAVAGKERHA